MRATWDKLPECTFGNFEIARVKQEQYQNFQKSRRLKKSPETNWNQYLLTAGNYKSESDYQITALMMQCQFQSIAWLVLARILESLAL